MRSNKEIAFLYLEEERTVYQELFRVRFPMLHLDQQSPISRPVSFSKLLMKVSASKSEEVRESKIAST